MELMYAPNMLHKINHTYTLTKFHVLQHNILALIQVCTVYTLVPIEVQLGGPRVQLLLVLLITEDQYQHCLLTHSKQAHKRQSHHIARDVDAEINNQQQDQVEHALVPGHSLACHSPTTYFYGAQPPTRTTKISLS